jgi:TetR/AcrR family transcriptional repressor of nem operon
MLAAEAPMIPAEIAEEVRGHFEDLSGWLAVTLEKGGDGPTALQGSAADEAKAFMSSVHGAMLAARGFGDAATFAALARLAIARVSAAPEKCVGACGDAGLLLSPMPTY